MPAEFVPQHGRPYHFEQLQPCRPSDVCSFASWNVEGVGVDTDSTKLEQITGIMKQRRIDVMCLQETHVPGAPYFVQGGCLIILSGGSAGKREYAG
eukprot:9467203-Pyramimonas_sp.AAC.1